MATLYGSDEYRRKVLEGLDAPPAAEPVVPHACGLDSLLEAAGKGRGHEPIDII